MIWTVGDRVVTVGTKREVEIIDTRDLVKVLVKFDDGTEMNVYVDRLFSVGSRVPSKWRIQTVEDYCSYISKVKWVDWHTKPKIVFSDRVISDGEAARVRTPVNNFE